MKVYSNCPTGRIHPTDSLVPALHLAVLGPSLNFFPSVAQGLGNLRDSDGVEIGVHRAPYLKEPITGP